jgi:S-adenosylmethionine/arginine decarboxylase-like enzyme
MSVDTIFESSVESNVMRFDCGSEMLHKRLLELGVEVEVDFVAGIGDGTQGFGTLLALDLYDCPVEPLSSIETGYTFLDGLAAKLGMTTQSPPFVFLSDANRFPDKAGLSGWVPLIQSGITLHTLIWTRFATVDVYSCSHVDPAETIAFAHGVFGPTRIEATYLPRGRKYPR